MVAMRTWYIMLMLHSMYIAAVLAESTTIQLSLGLDGELERSFVRWIPAVARLGVLVATSCNHLAKCTTYQHGP